MTDFLPVWNDTYSLLLPLSISMTLQPADFDKRTPFKTKQKREFIKLLQTNSEFGDLRPWQLSSWRHYRQTLKGNV